MKKKISIDGFKIGTWEDEKNATGVSVILCEDGATAGVEVRGLAPGTRETDLLKNECSVQQIHSVVLSGGSAFGIESAGGVMRYLSEKNIGFDTFFRKIPIVCSAVIYDLGIGNPLSFPTLENGYQACKNISNYVNTGNFGAGMGATCGKLKGFEYSMKTGVGYEEIITDDGLVVACYVVVNASGEVYENDNIISGINNNGKIISSKDILLNNTSKENPLTNTTIGCILTNAKLDKISCNRVAKTAHNGLSNSIRPVHTSMDGDTLFVMSKGNVKSTCDRVMYLAQEVTKLAVIDAAKSAKGFENIKSYQDLN